MRDDTLPDFSDSESVKRWSWDWAEHLEGARDRAYIQELVQAIAMDSARNGNRYLSSEHKTFNALIEAVDELAQDCFNLEKMTAVANQLAKLPEKNVTEILFYAANKFRETYQTELAYNNKSFEP